MAHSVATALLDGAADFFIPSSQPPSPMHIGASHTAPVADTSIIQSFTLPIAGSSTSISSFSTGVILAQDTSLAYATSQISASKPGASGNNNEPSPEPTKKTTMKPKRPKPRLVVRPPDSNESIGHIQAVRHQSADPIAERDTSHPPSSRTICRLKGPDSSNFGVTKARKTKELDTEHGPEEQQPPNVMSKKRKLIVISDDEEDVSPGTSNGRNRAKGPSVRACEPRPLEMSKEAAGGVTKRKGSNKAKEKIKGTGKKAEDAPIRQEPDELNLSGTRGDKCEPTGHMGLETGAVDGKKRAKKSVQRDEAKCAQRPLPRDTTLAGGSYASGGIELESRLVMDSEVRKSPERRPTNHDTFPTSPIMGSNTTIHPNTRSPEKEDRIPAPVPPEVTVENKELVEAYRHKHNSRKRSSPRKQSPIKVDNRGATKDDPLRPYRVPARTKTSMTSLLDRLNCRSPSASPSALKMSRRVLSKIAPLHPTRKPAPPPIPRIVQQARKTKAQELEEERWEEEWEDQYGEAWYEMPQEEKARLFRERRDSLWVED